MVDLARAVKWYTKADTVMRVPWVVEGFRFRFESREQAESLVRRDFWVSRGGDRDVCNGLHVMLISI